MNLRGLLVLTLVLIGIIAVSVTGSGNEQVLYLNETALFTHVSDDPVYLSVADGYTVIRLVVSRGIDVKELYLVVNGYELSMKPQLYLLDRIVWFGYTPYYTGKGFNYYFKAVLGNGTTLLLYSNQSNPLFYFNGVDKYPQVNWIRNRVGYQIFPDRFYNGDPGNDHYALVYDSLLYDNTTMDKPVLSNWTDPPHIPYHCCHQYYGGDLKGITMKLDYLKELGIGVIYLTPIFLCGSTHCYDIYDHYRLHPRLGTIDDLRELLNEAHKRDIKIVFDFVPGHVGLGFWAFQDVVVNGPNSTYWKWFTIYKWPFTPGDGRAYRCWWGFGSLPQLNTTIPEVKEYLVKAVIHWLETGFDGIRIDTPLDLLNPREFFEELRTAVKSRFPSTYIVGEIWQQKPEWVNSGPFDSLMNYALGLNILVEYAKGKYPDNIAYILSSYYAKYSVAVAGMGFNIIGSHDTDRVLTMLGGGSLFPEPNPSIESITRLKMLSTLQYTQPGMPVIFQGDERGIPGIRTYPWEEHRYPIQWDKLNVEVFEHYKKLGFFKNNLKPLHTSIIRVFETRSGVLAYTRGYNDEILVVANNRLEPAVFEIPADLSSTDWMVLYSSSGLEPEVTTETITIPPLTAVILLNKKYMDTVFVETPLEETSYTKPAEFTPKTPETTTITTPDNKWTTVAIMIIVVITSITIATIAIMILRKVRKHS